MSVKVHIDRLVIDRALAADPEALAAAVREAVTAQLATRPPSRARAIEQIDAGRGPAAPARIGGAVAGALGKALK
jgi:hypothetical protein